MSGSLNHLLDRMRVVPDFPEPGIQFFDITTLIADGQIFREIIDGFVERIEPLRPDRIVAVDARGFLLGGAIADRLGTGLVLVRKKGKLPHHTESVSYGLEYGEATIEIHADSFEDVRHAVIVDDVLATGGTAEATVSLVEKAGGTVIACAFLLELASLGGRGRLAPTQVESLITV
ncbi:MAG: adenine phosphoribosyltransferase [Candidatus Dadabacteria bacterium]|nr:MAG: adenine phosphoribosyltransferase [Candidatus Dadabacteria bacterium]